VSVLREAAAATLAGEFDSEVSPRVRDGGTLRFAIKTSGAQAIKQDVATQEASLGLSTI